MWRVCSKQWAWVGWLYSDRITDDFGLKEGVIKIDEMHGDIVEWDECCYYCEDTGNDEAVVIEIRDAILIAIYYTI